MPRSYIRLEGDDAEGHGVRIKYLDQGDAAVTVREDATGMEVKGHLRQEGDALVFESAEDDTEGQAVRIKYLDQEGDVTVRFDATGDEVKGHAYKIK
jgi:hypothetical protein